MFRKTRFDRMMDDLLSEEMPLDPRPYSNLEHLPTPPTAEQQKIYDLTNEQIEIVRRKYSMSRRDFVRTGAAITISLWAHQKVMGNDMGGYAWAGNSGPNVSDDPLWDACVLNNENVQLDNLPGEFILDVQSHHVMSDEKWRVLQPAHHAFICGVFGAVGNREAGNLDTCQNVGRWQYMKDIYLDSATSAGVLSPVPAAPDEQQALPFDEAHETAEMMESLAGTMRVVTHGYVMPNRGWFRSHDVGPYAVEGRSLPEDLGSTPGAETPGAATPQIGIPAEDAREGETKPAFLDDELDWMEQRAIRYRRYLRGWKVYTPYGDVPFTSGMAHDDYAGRAMNDKIIELGDKFGIPKVLASHKGIWLPAFDDRRQACDDVGPAAVDYPQIKFVIYHTGGGASGNYPADRPNGQTAGLNEDQDEAAIDTTDYNNGTWGLIKVLREHGLDAQSNIPWGFAHGNTPNVSVDTGIGGKTAVFYGTMIKHIGPRRICHGTDAIWGGSPQGIIAGLRSINLTDQGKEFFNLPHGFEGDRFDPRVDAFSGADYTQAYKDMLEAANAGWVGSTEEYTQEVKDIIANWPTDGQPHPERSIRNGYLGRNAVDVYGFDGEEMQGAISCDDVNRLRQEYLTDQLASLKSIGPTRANRIWGPRTPQETINMRNREWKEEGWIA